MFKKRETTLYSEPEFNPRGAPLERREPPPRIFPSQVTPMRPPPPKEEPQWESSVDLHTNLDEPEAILAEGISVSGTLRFERYLRIDGEFEGEILSPQGKIVVGPKGVVRSNLHLREAIIEGAVEGNIVATQRVELRGKAQVKGNVETPTLSVDEGVSLVGQVNVQPAAP